MLYRRINVSTRTLFSLIAVLLLLVIGVGSAFAANTGTPPQLVPYSSALYGGQAQGTAVNGLPTNQGYSGDGGPATAAWLFRPQTIAFDPGGNIYFTDAGNNIIREINMQSGIINTVAGVTPVGCVNSQACHNTAGCADGVPALGNPIGSNLQGIAVDNYGNVFFDDALTATVSVIYRGGTQVANLIQLENPTGVSTAGGVKPGYVYHIAGTINLSACSGSITAAASATKAAIPAGDGNLAFQGATFNGPGSLALDSAGNLFIGDAGNGVIRVINTQSTAQTFFNVTVQPGFIMSIVNCSPLTTTCPIGAGTAPFTLANTGLGGPAGGGYFTTLSGGTGQWMTVDALGNVYELNYKGGLPFISLGVAYAGGSVLGNLINNALLGDTTTVVGATSLKASPGNFYYLLQNVTLRPRSVAVDNTGNIYYLDDHYSEIYRVDINAAPYPGNGAGDFLGIMYPTGMLQTGNFRNNPASTAKPVFCYPIGSSTTNVGVAGPMTSDPFGDGCPASFTQGPGQLSVTNGIGGMITDGQGALYLTDYVHPRIFGIQLNNTFPATPVGQAVNPTTLVGQQTIQVHFDAGNLPVKATTTPNVTTSAFSIAPGITDFSISPNAWNVSNNNSGTVTTAIAIGANTPAVTAPTTGPELPVCVNLTGAVDNSSDCAVNVIFSPTAPGLRQSQLVVTTANGSIYNFGLSGMGTGPQIAVDGGTPTAVSVAGMGNPGQIAVTQTGYVYIADPSNNRVVKMPVGGGTVATVGTGLKSPMGVAVDAAGDVFIADTGNNRIVEINVNTGAQTVLGSVTALQGFTGGQQYTFKGPQGIAVDLHGNVYVADTGNAKIVEIASYPTLGAAAALWQYPGAYKFTNPVGVAVDASGNVYVADTGYISIIEMAPGGGDLINLPSDAQAAIKQYASPAVAKGTFTAPSSVAVDAAGNLYVGDSGANAVYVVPNTSDQNFPQYALNFTNLNLAGSSFVGGSVGLDANGNLYVADSGNSRLLFVNRQNPTVAYGLIPQNQPTLTSTLYVTNIGNVQAALSSPFTSMTTTPSGNASFTSTETCSKAAIIGPPTNKNAPYCTITTSFAPTAGGAQSALISLNGLSQSVSITSTVESPLANIVLSATTPTAGSTSTVTATLTQAHGPVPTGTVTFTYTVNGVATGSPVTVPLTVAGSSSTATFSLPPGATLAQGRQYVVSATYSGDSQNTQTAATPLTVYVPGVPVTATATNAPITITYGTKPPAITGTVTGITDSSVTYTFTTPATATTPVGTYPISVVFAGGTYLNYGFPPVVTSTGAPATVIENKANLAVTASNASLPYGSPNLVPTYVVTGAVNGDQFNLNATYTTNLPAPAPPTTTSTNALSVGIHSITPSVAGPKAGNYNTTVTNGSLTVTQAPVSVTLSTTANTVLPANVSATPVVIQVTTAVPSGIGTPTGSVTVTDTFTPIIPTAPGTGTPAAPVTIGPLSLIAGSVSFVPAASTTLGTHVYTATYSGDPNFTKASSLTPLSYTIDNADFSVTSTTSPILIAPGILPGGNSSVAGQSAATPQQATVTIGSVLAYSGTVFVGCQTQNPSYVTCSLSPSSVAVTSTVAGVSVLSIQTPATLPLGFFSSELRHPVTTTVLAFVPFGVLAFCFRRRKRLSKVLWMLLAIGALSTGLNGCGSTTVAYYTPVPAGPQTVTVFACTVQATCTTANPVTSPITGQGAGTTRSFTVNISVQ